MLCKGPSFKEPGHFSVVGMGPLVSGGEWWDVLPGRLITGSWTGEGINGAGAMEVQPRRKPLDDGFVHMRGNMPWIAQRNLFLSPL